MINEPFIVVFSFYCYACFLKKCSWLGVVERFNVVMPIEFEVKFFVNFVQIKEKAQNFDGTCIRPRGLMRRFIFSVAGKPEQWIRVRDEGEYVALTLKSFDSGSSKVIESVRELEVKVSDFDKMIQMLELLGHQKSLYLENYREVWSVKDCLVMFDELPGLDPIIEIEGSSQRSVEAVAILLGLDMNVAMYGPNRLLYEKAYGIEFNTLRELTFSCHPGIVKA